MDLNSIIFPAPTCSYTSSSFPDELFWIPHPTISSQDIPCLYLPCPRGSSKVMMYFHGNAEDIGLTYDLLDHLRLTLLVHIIAVEYPGYGIYTGSPSASAITSDAVCVFDFLTDVLGINPRNIIVFGRSIGSGPATYLAANKQPGALLLMSAYTNMKAAVRSIAGRLAQYFVADRFRNIDLMPRVTCPTFLIHGQQDTLIPYSLSQELHEACSGPSSLILPKNMDHNQFDFYDDLSLPFAGFLIQCGISVYPGSHEDKFLNIPPQYFASSDTWHAGPAGTVNKMMRRLG
jgi:pimeloyl-ACP methyl ester carboxylesterase